MGGKHSHRSEIGQGFLAWTPDADELQAASASTGINVEHLRSYVGGPKKDLKTTEQALLNNTVLCASTSGVGTEFNRSVVEMECEWQSGTFLEYGIPRYFAAGELFDNCASMNIAK